MYGKLLMSNSKNSGPSIEPCGTSCLTLSQSEFFFSICFLSLLFGIRHLNINYYCKVKNFN